MINFNSSKVLLNISSVLINLRGIHNLKIIKLNKSLLNLKGEESFQFLQGLISNDIRQFMNNFRLPFKRSIFSLLLQSNGRTLADFILYNTGEQIDYVHVGNGRSSSDFEGHSNQSVMLECDVNLKSNLIKLFKIYKLKKKLELSENNQFFAWSIYSPDFKPFELKECKLDNSLILTADPRLNYLGYRCLSNESEFPKLIDQLQSANLIDKYSVSQGNLQDYVHHRYRLGVGEGVMDHPIGQCLPLEDNADLLNGLDFNKGCYLGQELVARTHYTGVVRKRLLPIEVIKFNDQELNNCSINKKSHLIKELSEKVKFGITLHRKDQPNKRLGKVRAISSTSNLGLGLLYHKELEQCNHSAVNHELGLLIKINKPIWWPMIN